MNDININTLPGAKSYATANLALGKNSKVNNIRPTEPTAAFNVTLSDDAQGFLKDIPGKSVAKRARAALAQEGFEALSDVPFGKIVSTLARGVDLSTLLPEPVVEEQPVEIDETPTEEVPIILTEEEPTETILGNAEIALSLLTTLDEEIV